MSTPAHELIKETEHLPVYFDVGACGDTAIPAHWHNYLEIVYLLKGRMTAVIQAEKYSLHPGDLLIINCKDLHMTRKETPETEYKAESGNAGSESGEHRSDRGRKEYTARFFDFFSRESKYIREQAVLSRIDDAHLMDYLALEQKRYESEQNLRDERGKRILSAFQLAVSLAAIVAVIGFLKDEPTVLVNILYIIGIIAALWLWKMKK